MTFIKSKKKKKNKKKNIAKHQKHVLSIKLRFGMWYDVMVLFVQADNSGLHSKFSAQN